MNIIEEYFERKIIEKMFMDIITKGNFPTVGSPECKCKKCMFFEIACNPRDGVVGCFHGWKLEEVE